MDYSIRQLSIEDIRATQYKCPCARCKNENNLLTWDGIKLARWYGKGACPYTLAIRFAKLELRSNFQMDLDITDKLLRKSDEKSTY